MTQRVGISLLALLVAAALLAGSLFTVGQGEAALLTRLGRLEPAVYGPGLHWKSPLDRIHRLDERLTTRSYPGESFLTSDQRTLSIDLLLRYRLAQPLAFYRESAGDEDVAAQRLVDLTRDRLKSLVAGESLAMVSSLERGGLTAQGLQSLRQAAQGLGIDLVDLQLERIELSDQAASLVYQRMEQSFNDRAEQLDATGTLQAERLRADAERKRAELLADATRQSQQIRTAADARAAALYARSYGKNPELADFVQSLTAYKSSLGHQGDVLIVTPEGDFFKYLRSPSGHESAAAVAGDGAATAAVRSLVRPSPPQATPPHHSLEH